MLSKALLASAAVVALAACAGEEGREAGTTVDRDTLSQRQKDSIVAEMPLPGSGGVRRALDAQNRLNRRATEHDSIAGRR